MPIGFVRNMMRANDDVAVFDAVGFSQRFQILQFLINSSIRRFVNSSMQRLAITWFGHSTFLIRTPGGKRLLFDPWLQGNPACPEALKKPPKVDLILVSHGHGDHIDDL